MRRRRNRSISSQAPEQQQGGGAGEDADGSEAGRINPGVLQGRAAEERVSGESNHRQQGEEEKAYRFRGWLPPE